MVFDDVFQRFVEAAPACVMYRALMENIFALQARCGFHKTAKKQYERELLFSTLVTLTSQVVCRISEKVRTAYLSQQQITVSLTAVYDKLQGVELETSRALVQHSARETSELIGRCKGLHSRCCRATACGSWMETIWARRNIASMCCVARRPARCPVKRWCFSTRSEW